MKTILVTGGAGFIGSHFIDLLLDVTDYFIIVLDKLTYAGKSENMSSFIESERVNFIKGDICDSDLLKTIFEKFYIDYVVNFAAESHVDNSITSPGIFVITNIIGTHTLINVSKSFWEKDTNWRETHKFIQISTDEVYGMLGDEGMFTEETSINPSSPYSASKASADLLCLSYYKTFGYPIIITRSSNNYGPRQDKEKLIPKSIINSLTGKKIPIYGSGMNIRDWIYVVDNSKAIYLLSLYGISGNVYNISGKNELRNIDFVKNIISKTNLDYENLIEFVPDRIGHDYRYSVDDSKTKSIIGEYATSSFDESVKETIYYYLKSLNLD